MPTSAIVCAECQNAWPQGAAVCPVCGSRVSHVGATGVHLGRDNAAAPDAPAAPVVRRPRVAANATAAARNGAVANGVAANGVAANGVAANGVAANGVAANGAASNGAAPSLQAAPKIVSQAAPSLQAAPEVAALEAGIGLRGQTVVVENVLRRGGFCISYAARVAGQSAIVQELVPPGCVRRGREVVAARMAASEFENIKHRFEAEARSLLSFSHPGIVAARLVFEENNTFYLAMERAPGQTLQERVEASGPLSPEQAVGVIGQIGAVIVALHEAGLAHGDIRAANVSLSRAASVEQTPNAAAVEYALRAMLNDWGLERWLEESYVLTGSAEAAASPQSDVAGLAATLFFALTGQRPPASAHDAARLLGVSDSPEDGESATLISHPLAEAVLRGLERDPQHPLTARAWLQSLQPTAPPAKSPRAANRTPFDALLSGQNKAAAPVAERAAAKPEARDSAAQPRAANRWIQDVALSVGGALLVGLAAWMLTTQTSNREAAAPTGNFVTPQANADSNANAVTPIETPRALSAAPPTPQVTPESQLSAPSPRADKPPQVAPQVAPPKVAPQTIASPTPSAPIAPRRVSSGSAASSLGVKPSVTQRKTASPRRPRRVEAATPDEIQPAAPRPRLRAARRFSASRLTPRPPIERFPIERPQRQRVAPTVELPLEAPSARFKRGVPRLRRRAANRVARRRARRIAEPGLPPSLPSSSPEAGLPPAP